MASSRLLAKLVTTTGGVSSGLLHALQENDHDDAIDIVPELIELVAASIAVRNPEAGADASERLARDLIPLIERYGTLRRVIEAFADGRRPHDLVSTEKAGAWRQAMTVTPGAIEPILKRHASLLVVITAWLTNRGPRIEGVLDGVQAWLDAPFDSDDATSESPAAPRPKATPEPETIEIDENADRDNPDVRLIRDDYLDDKHPTETPGSRTLDDEQVAALERLRTSSDAYDRAVAAVAGRDFPTADAFIRGLDGRIEPIRLLLLKADRYFMESRHDEALLLFRQVAHMSDSADARMNIAVCLLHAERGASDENIREAIDLLTEIIANADENSLQWAKAQATLGAAWSRRPAGDRDENLRHAIEAFSQALPPLKEENAHWWAETNFQLGVAWMNVPTGDRAENYQRGILCFHAALEYWTREAQPQRWGTIQNHLGAAWERYPRGDRSKNLGQAIQCFTNASAINTRVEAPTTWANIQNNLGNAWIQFPDGDVRQNIQRGIACHQSALEVWSEQNRRTDWAGTQTNLGNAWALMPAHGEERSKNLRRAIACYKAALEVRTRATSPIAWAATLNNLGSALLLLPPGKRGDNIHEAIECFTRALEVRTRDAFPLDWAKTQANLGHAWAKRPDGDRTDNLTESMAYYECALEVLDHPSHPHQHQHIAARLREVREEFEHITNRP